MTIRDNYLAAAAATVALLRDPAVAAGWRTPSALPEFGVAGLAGHLAGQILVVSRALAGPTPADPVPLLDHYTLGRWIGSGLDEEFNVSIRRSGEQVAADGPAALADRTDAELARLRDALPAEAPDRVIHIPGKTWSLRLDDYLVTRLMEIAVHNDDLAVSVGIAAPELPPAALEPVFDLLTRLAVRRHGPTAVLRALSRAERAPATIAAI